MTDNEARARELAEKLWIAYNFICTHNYGKTEMVFSGFKIIAAALKAERAAGLRRASEIVQDVPLNPVFDLSNGQVVRVCGLAANAIDAEIAALQTDSPA